MIGKKQDFNPIIGLILTMLTYVSVMILSNFNPIIGLILTRDQALFELLLSRFQSHYRSDFNFPRFSDATPI